MKTICQVCMHHCALEPGQTGLCRARKNEGGEIVCENYGWITSLALDPIEKSRCMISVREAWFCPWGVMGAISAALSARITRFP